MHETNKNNCLVSPVLLHQLNAAALIISIARLKSGKTKFSILTCNLKIVLLPLQSKKVMPACCNLKILAWESRSYSFCDHMEVSDVSYPRHVICFLQGSAQLQGLDEERLAKMAEHLNQYNCQLSSMGPGFQTVSGHWPVSFILLCAR